MNRRSGLYRRSCRPWDILFLCCMSCKRCQIPMSYGEYSIFTHSDAFWLLPLQHTSLKRFEHGEKCLVDSDRSIVVPRGSPESGWFTAVFFGVSCWCCCCLFSFVLGLARHEHFLSGKLGLKPREKAVSPEGAFPCSVHPVRFASFRVISRCLNTRKYERHD